MKPFEILTSVAAPFVQNNVDTDQILPARYMAQRRELGYGQYCLRDLRFTSDGSPKADFVLNQPAYAGAEILLSGSNFGCGSSREGAVYALLDLGIRVVIAESFGDIFYQNALINGLLPVVLAPPEIELLVSQLHEAPAAKLVIDLEHQVVTTPSGQRISFAIDQFRKMCLLSGVDEISFTNGFQAEISTFEQLHAPR